MKRFLALSLSFLLCLSMTACSNNATSQSSSSSSSSSNTSSDAGASSMNSSDEVSQNNANIEIIQDADAIYATLTGDIVALANEYIEKGNEMQLTLQFEDQSRGYLGSFMLLSTDDGYVHKVCNVVDLEQSIDIAISYSSEQVIFSCTDCPIDFSQVGYVSAYVYADEEFLVNQSFAIDEISFTQGEYQSSGTTDEYGMVGIYSSSSDDQYSLAELIFDDFGYTVVYDDNTYQMNETLSTSDDELFLRGYSSENPDIAMQLSLMINYSNPCMYITLVQDNTQIYSDVFSKITTLTNDYYTYVDGEKVESAISFEIQDSMFKLNILDKYETDWIQMTSEVIYSSYIRLDDIPATVLADGSRCMIDFSSAQYTDENDVLLREVATFEAIAEEWQQLDIFAFFSYYDTDFEEYTMLKDVLLNKFEYSITGETLEFTEDQIIYNGETLAEISIDQFIQTYFTFGYFCPLYVDGTLKYEFRFYIYNYEEPELSVNITNYDTLGYVTSGQYTVQ